MHICGMYLCFISLILDRLVLIAQTLSGGSVVYAYT